MHGNAWEWCDDSYQDYPKVADAISKDLGSTKPVANTDSRVLRGGAFYIQPVFVRSAYRLSTVLPAYRFHFFGFRPVRTLP